ncbi:MAG: hypothetical protein ABI780_02470 [Ardenticatenales bacterium]
MAYLALRPGVACSRVGVGELFWPDVPEAKARKLLSLHLFTLLQRLNGVGLENAIDDARDTIRLRADLRTDVQDFTELSLAGGVTADPAEQARYLHRAALLYGEGLLPSYDYPWVVVQRIKLRELYDRTVTRLADILDPSGQLQGIMQALPPTAWHGLERLGVFAVPEQVVAKQTAEAARQQPATPAAEPSTHVRSTPTERVRMTATERDLAAPMVLAPPAPDEGAFDDEPRSERLRAIARLVAANEDVLDSPDRQAAVDVLSAHIDDIRAALTRPSDRRSFAVQLEMAAALWRFWRLAGAVSEGRRYLDTLLSQPYAVPEALQAKASHAAGTLAVLASDRTVGIRHLRRALDAWHAVGDDIGLLRSLINLAIALQEEQAFEESRDLNRQAISIARRVGREGSLSKALLNQALNELHLGNAAAARALLGERLALSVVADDPAAAGATHSQLASAALIDDDLSTARAHAEIALRLLDGRLDARARSAAHRVMGRVLYWEDQLAAATEHYLQGIEAAREVNDMAEVGSGMAFLALTCEAMGETDQASIYAANATALLRSAGQTIALARFEAERQGLRKRARGGQSEPDEPSERPADG